MHRAAETAIDEHAVARPEQALDQRDPPGQPEIAVAGLARGIDIGADMRPRRADDRQNIRRREQHLEVDVGSFFEMVAEKANVMRQDAGLDLVDDLGLRHGRRGGHQRPNGREADQGNPAPRRSLSAKRGPPEPRHPGLPVSECAHHLGRDHPKVTRGGRACQWA